MSVEVIYRIIDRHGNIVEETVDKKTADLIDQRLDAIYEICDFLLDPRSPMRDLGSEQDAEKLAEHLVDNRDFLTAVLKKVKNIPTEQSTTPARGMSGSSDQHKSDEAA
ncbi:MAG: YebG family protein [Candidatus Competibacteraceae bacterium]|nr:YebG family protein [Candidatus Competibacteraceae bacterium]